MKPTKPISISLKLILSNLCYAIPVLVLVYLMVSVYNENINFAVSESKGNAHQRPLEDLFHDIGQHSYISQKVLLGDISAKETLISLQERIDKKITAVDESTNKYLVDLQFTDEGLKQRQRDHLKMSILKKDWDDLKKQVLTLKPSENYEKHYKIVSSIRGMITHLGDTSNLILDPDLDSYYLMDVTLVTIPQMQERILDIISKGHDIIKNKNVTADNKKWLIVSAALLKQSDLDRLTADIQTTLNEDKNFYGPSESLQKNIPPATEELKKSTEELVSLLEALSTSDTVQIPAEKFTKASTELFDLSFKYWNKAVDELDVLLNTRIETQTNKKTKSLWYSFFALIIAALGSTLLGLSIRQSIVKSISEVVDQMKVISEIVDKSNAHLVGASQNLAAGTNNQASAIQETVSTLEEISSMTQKSADGASNSAEHAKQSQMAAFESKKSVQKMVEALEDINNSNGSIIEQVTQGNQKIADIVNMIQEIGNKTKVINEIVFQTKLLSFNASVEAARAGEHGKGFAVVAEEVGNLAQMSGNAAKEISTLLEQSISNVNSIIEDTKHNLEKVIFEGKSKMDFGLEIANNCEQTLNVAVEKVEMMTKLMAEIAGATKEQAVGVSEIGKAMNLLDQTTQQNAVTADEVANLSQELEDQAINLKNTIITLESRMSNKKPLETMAPSDRQIDETGS